MSSNYPGCRLSVQFMSLEGKFRNEGDPKVFAGEAEALAAVRSYAEAAGYSGIKVAVDASDDCVRFVGRTPGGRSGRNVAFGDWIPGEDLPCNCGEVGPKECELHGPRE